MSAISDNLIHFLARNQKDSPGKQLEVFKLIIENGLRTGRVLIKFAEGGTISNQIVCFTDIPLRECNEHTSVYGKFGIGFKKSYVKNAGGNPARYFLDYVPGQIASGAGIETRGVLYHNLSQQHKFLLKLHHYVQSNPSASLFDAKGQVVLGAEELAHQVSLMILSYSFDKEMGDLGPARDETKEIDLYYKEREWRLVPSDLSDDSKTAHPVNGSDCFSYRFDRNDVNMVVVPNEEVRAQILDYFDSLKTSTDERLKSFATNQLPVMNYDDLHKW